MVYSLNNFIKTQSPANYMEGRPGGAPQSGFASTIDVVPPSAQDLNEEFKNIMGQGSQAIAMIGSKDLSMSQIKIIEMIAYGLALSGNTIITSGGYCGTNYATIKGALRADVEKLRVVLPQTIAQQIKDVQDQLIGVKHIVEHKEREHMLLSDASRLCNREIVFECHQLICFLYRDSHTLLDAIDYAHSLSKVVSVFYLD
jgi:hypothetical protein